MNYDWHRAVAKVAAKVTPEAAMRLATMPVAGRHDQGRPHPKLLPAVAAAARGIGFSYSTADLGGGSLLGHTVNDYDSRTGEWDRYIEVDKGMSPASTLRVSLHELGHAMGAPRDEQALAVDMLHRMMAGEEDGVEEAVVELSAAAVLARLGLGEYNTYSPGYVGIKLEGFPGESIQSAAAELAEEIFGLLVRGLS